MFNTEILESIIKKFNYYFRVKMEAIIKREQENYKQLGCFLNTFSLEKIPEMTLEQYCFAKGNKNTFCYWVENTLNDLGDIHITGQNGFQKFGIQNIDGNYVYKKRNQKNCKYGNNPDEVYKTINSELQKVIKAAISFDVDAVEKSMFPGVFKSKLTYLYNKEQWMPIYVHPDVDKLLGIFKINFSSKESITQKRIKLYEFYLEVKKHIPFITTWEFMDFIYDDNFGYKDYLRKGRPITRFDIDSEVESSSDGGIKSEETEDEKDELDLTNEELTEFVGTYTINSSLDKKATESRKKRNAPIKNNYQKKQKNNERKGTIGEKLIVNDEISKLANLGYNFEVKHNAATDDSLGYDITSYDENGQEIYIEVKTTTTDRIDGFHISRKEVLKAIELGEKYKLYRVYCLNVKEKKYKVEIINGKELFDKFRLVEANFVAEVR